MVRAKYFIAHLLKGDVERYHQRLTKSLSKRFRTVELHKKAPPHITVKIPFEASATEIAGVEHVLHDFSSRSFKTPLVLENFGRFGHRTVFLDAQHSRESVNLVRECIADLNKLPWMQTVEHEGNKLHASVARFLTPVQFRRIWRLLKYRQSRFEVELDTLAILKKEPNESSWKVYREFTLNDNEKITTFDKEEKLLQLHT